MVLVFVILTDYLSSFLVIYASIFLHELGHIVIAMLFGRQIYSLTLLPVGLNATIEEGATAGFQNIVIFAIGPIINIFLAIAGFLLSSFIINIDESIYFFIRTNIYLSAFNMLPILPLDGAKILREAIIVKAGLFAAYRYIKAVTLVLFLAIIILGLIQFILSGNNLSLLIAGFYFYSSLKQDRSEAAMMNIKSFIFRRSRILKKGVYPARELVAIKSMRLGEIIKNMDFDRFHIVYVLDNDMRIMGHFSEQEIIDSLLKYSSDMTFEMLIDMERDKTV